MPTFTIETNLLDTSVNAKINASDIQGFVKSLNQSTPLIADAQSFIDNADKYGINVVWVLAHCIEETADGTSFYATQRHNLFGYQAYTEDPNQAATYKTDADSIAFYCDFIDKYYLHPGFYTYTQYGPTPQGLNQHYATDPLWAEKIVAIMNEFSAFYVKSHIPAPNPTPVSHPAQNTYVVQEGDSLSAIAAAHGIANWEDLYNWNKAIIGPDPNLIRPGQVLVLDGAPAPVVNTYTVHEGDSLSEIAAKYGISWQSLYFRNKNVIGSNPDLIFAGQVLVIP